jgi:hypothetical protein
MVSSCINFKVRSIFKSRARAFFHSLLAAFQVATSSLLESLTCAQGDGEPTGKWLACSFLRSLVVCGSPSDC